MIVEFSQNYPNAQDTIYIRCCKIRGWDYSLVAVIGTDVKNDFRYFYCSVCLKYIDIVELDRCIPELRGIALLGGPEALLQYLKNKYENENKCLIPNILINLEPEK